MHSKISAKVVQLFELCKYQCVKIDVFCKKSTLFIILFAHVRKKVYFCRRKTKFFV